MKDERVCKFSFYVLRFKITGFSHRQNIVVVSRESISTTSLQSLKNRRAKFPAAAGLPKSAYFADSSLRSEQVKKSVHQEYIFLILRHRLPDGFVYQK